jgi:hypothetical protein
MHLYIDLRINFEPSQFMSHLMVQGFSWCLCHRCVIRFRWRPWHPASESNGGRRQAGEDMCNLLWNLWHMIKKPIHIFRCLLGSFDASSSFSSIPITRSPLVTCCQLLSPNRPFWSWLTRKILLSAWTSRCAPPQPLSPDSRGGVNGYPTCSRVEIMVHYGGPLYPLSLHM